MEKLIEALPSLLEKQQELDGYIMRERGLTHDETIEQRKLAFVVELAELAQEWRGFKYWSDNQQPSDKMLEEYVDVLHFALSLHNYYKGDTQYAMSISLTLEEKEYASESKVLELFSEILQLNDNHYWREGTMLIVVVMLGNKLLLSGEDILKEYDRKYQINIERQNNGY